MCEILLPDSGHLQEEDAEHANKHRTSKHRPALPLYTKNDALIALKQLHALDFGKFYELVDGLSFRFQRAGHIIGAASVIFKEDNRILIFSGDVGRLHDPIMAPPEQIDHCDYLITESTYGDRLHDKQDSEEKIARRTHSIGRS